MNIRLVESADAEMLAKYFKSNEVHFRPWEPLREDGYYGVEALALRLAGHEIQHERGLAANFIGLVGRNVVAHCSFTNIVYGPFRACHMGFGVSREHQGVGVMTEVCKVAIRHAFEVLSLNRIMANYMPCNTRSARLLEKLGFSTEGVARKYLKINGSWEDHVLASLINPESR